MAEAMARGYAYQAVYDYLSTLIAEATGERKIRLPSLRDLANRLAVSVSTVQHAYQLLESEGRIVSVPKSGYYAVVAAAPPIPAADPAVPAAEPDLLQSLYHHACTPGMLVLHRSDPWPGDAFGQALTAREREIQRQHRSLGSHPLGEPSLRRELAARYTRGTHHRWCADDVYLAADLRAMLDIILCALDIRGRTVMITTPASPVWLMALKAADMDVCELPLDAAGAPDLAQAAHCLRARSVALVILGSTFNGPQGALMPSSRRQALAELFDQHGSLVLEDDDHGELCFSSETPMREWVAPERLLVCGSFARTIGAEARYAYLLVPPQARSPIALPVRQCLLQRDFQLPPVRQKAVARLYQRGAIDGNLRSLRNGLKLNVGRLVQQLDDNLGDLLNVPMPAGGNGVWVSGRHPTDAQRVYEHLLKRRILIAPGPLFSSQGHHRQCLRIACPVNGMGLPGRVIAELRKALQASRV